MRRKRSLQRLVRVVVGFCLATAGLAPSGILAFPAAPHVGPEVPVTPVDLVEPRANNSPSVAVDPTESLFVALAARVDSPQFGCTLHLSGDGGRGWLPATPVPNLPSGVERCYAPVVDFDQTGVLYFMFIGLHGPGNTPAGVFLANSADRGHTFSAPHQVLGANNFMVRMVIDRTIGPSGRIHLVWVKAMSEPSLGGFPPTSNPILSIFSDDGGKTFSSPVQVSDQQRERVVAPALALGTNHAVHVLYYDLQKDVVDYRGLEGPTWEDKWSLVISTSKDGGRTFGRGVSVDDDVIPPERVMLIFTMPPAALAADSAGRVYAAWYDARNGDWDVFSRRSLDGGASWEKSVRVNDDPVGDGRHQYLPNLSVAADGRLDAVFYDRRNDPQNLRNDLYYTSSTDHGRSFAPNLRLTTDSSDTRNGPKYGVVSAKGLFEFGSRPALLSAGTALFVAWTDTRNALPGMAQQDILLDQLIFPGAPAPPASAGGFSWAWVLIPALMGFLVLALLVVRRRRSRTRGRLE